MENYQNIKAALKENAIPENITILQRFFKTGKGQYGEGDIFIGVKVPNIRAVAKAYYKETPKETLQKLLESTIHEERNVALFILVLQYQKAKQLDEKKAIFDFYLEHKLRINNWDLVDNSTHKIVGPYLHETNQVNYLFKLAADEDMWTKRIAVVALWYLWKQGYTELGLQLIHQNLQHPHDLMHKANGWMLRELSKHHGEDIMLAYVMEHYHQMPRTTLRYAIEKVAEPLRTNILKGNF